MLPKPVRALIFGVIALPLMAMFIQMSANPQVGPFLSAQLATPNDIQIITGGTCPPGGSIHNKIILSEDKARPGHFVRDVLATRKCSNLAHNVARAYKPGINQKVSIYDTATGETAVEDVQPSGATSGAVKLSLADPSNLKQNIELLVSTDPASAGTFLVVEELDANDNTIAYYEWKSKGAGTNGTDFIFLPKQSRFRFTASIQANKQVFTDSITKTSADADQNPPDFRPFLDKVIATSIQTVSSQSQSPTPYCGFYDIDGDGVNSSTQIDANGNPIPGSNPDLELLNDIILGNAPLSDCQNTDPNGTFLGNCNFIEDPSSPGEVNVTDLQRVINFYTGANTACEAPFIAPSSTPTTPSTPPQNLSSSSVEITTACDQPGSRYYLSMLVRNPQTDNFEVIEEVSDLCENWETQPLLIENFDGTLDYAFGILNGDGPNQGFTNGTFLNAGNPPVQYQTSINPFTPQQLPEEVRIPTPVNPGIPELEIRLQRYSSGIAQESYWKVVGDTGEEVFYLNPGQYEVEISLNGQSEHLRMDTNNTNTIPDFSNFLSGSAPGSSVAQPPAGSPELDIEVLANGTPVTAAQIRVEDSASQVFCEDSSNALVVTCIFNTPGFKTLKITPLLQHYLPTFVNVNVGNVQSIGPISLRFYNEGENLFLNFTNSLLKNGNIADKSLKQFIDYAISIGL